MKIYELQIKGYKSIADIRLINPNPFSVFVGPNGAGKSNIFEALELFERCNYAIPSEVVKEFGDIGELFNMNLDYSPILSFVVNLNPLISTDNQHSLYLHFEPYSSGRIFSKYQSYGKGINGKDDSPVFYSSEYLQFTNFTRLFINQPKQKVSRNIQDNSRLASDASNLEKVLKRILNNPKHRLEIVELLQLLVPGFADIEIRTEELSGSENMVIYEDKLKKPLTKRLISDGTYNILALIAAVYQSDEPQFLCIEEPENGLNPKVVKALVSLFRNKCGENGHYIWLNTHSQTLVSELTTSEIILVDKIDGNTIVKQVQDFELHGLKMDEALLTNTLGGGIPW